MFYKLILAFVAAAIPAHLLAGELVETDASLFEAVSVARSITNADHEQKFPLVAAFGSSGRLCGFVQEWTADSRTKIEAMLDAPCSGSAQDDLFRNTKFELDSKEGIASVVAVSLGAACAPCGVMANDLERLASANPKIAVKMIVANSMATAKP